VGTLEFIPGTRKALRMLANEPEEFARTYGVKPAAIAPELARQNLEFLRQWDVALTTEWFSYWAIEAETQEMVGVCSYKGPPVAGVVEIAYGTFDGHEGRGIATAMVRFLVDRVRESDEVRMVIAHTWRERNASCRVLEKLGMTFAGEEVEDGEPVWRWELPLR
jgi:RimJ/RimL family protein N-acetyltransferase